MFYGKVGEWVIRGRGALFSAYLWTLVKKKKKKEHMEKEVTHLRNRLTDILFSFTSHMAYDRDTPINIGEESARIGLKFYIFVNCLHTIKLVLKTQ